MVIEYKGKKFKKGDIVSIFYREKGAKQLKEAVGVMTENAANIFCIETEDGFRSFNIKSIVNIFKYEKEVECDFM